MRLVLIQALDDVQAVVSNLFKLIEDGYANKFSFDAILIDHSGNRFFAHVLADLFDLPLQVHG